MADLENPEKHRLELEKMKMEVELLKKQLESKENRKSRADKLKEWLPLGTTMIGIFGGLLTFWITADAYLKELAKENARAQFQHEIVFDKEIIGLINTLDDADLLKREYAAMMLTSYNLNSVPVLLFMLERKDPEENAIYIKTLKEIYQKPSVDKQVFFARITNATNSLFLKEYEMMDSTLDNSGEINFYGLENHIMLFKEMAPVLSVCEKAGARAMLAHFENMLSQKEIHASILGTIEIPIQVTMRELVGPECETDEENGSSYASQEM